MRSPEPEVRTPYTQGGEVRTSVVAGLLTTTSLKVAAVFGKDHARVLSRIRALGEIHAAYFGLMKCNPKLDWRLPICWLPRGLPANCRFDSSRGTAHVLCLCRSAGRTARPGRRRSKRRAARLPRCRRRLPCSQLHPLHPVQPASPKPSLMNRPMNRPFYQRLLRDHWRWLWRWRSWRWQCSMRGLLEIQESATLRSFGRPCTPRQARSLNGFGMRCRLKSGRKVARKFRWRKLRHL